MVWRYFDRAKERKSRWLNPSLGRFRRDSKFGFWTARFTQNDGFFSRPSMQVHNGEPTADFKNCLDGKG